MLAIIGFLPVIPEPRHVLRGGGDAPHLALLGRGQRLGDGDPQDHIDPESRRAGQQGHQHDDPDEGHVHVEVIGQAGADAGHALVLHVAVQLLGDLVLGEGLGIGVARFGRAVGHAQRGDHLLHQFQGDHAGGLPHFLVEQHPGGCRHRH